MLTDEIRKKIKKIRIHTKRMMYTDISGDYLSAFKGSGLEFDQIREYQLGDDVRFIDWNSSAKMNKIMIKQFVEERDRTIILAIDLSSSSLYSSSDELRQDLIAQISAAIACISGENKDKIGALFFTDQVEKWIPPNRGRAHSGKILETIFSIKPKGCSTSIENALTFLIKLKKKNAVVFFISDWIDDLDSYSKVLRVASCEYDMIGVRVLDKCEESFPDIGFLQVKNPENGQIFTLDSRHTSKLEHFFAAKYLEQKKLFSKHKIDLLDLKIGRPFVTELINFLHKRIRRQI